MYLVIILLFCKCVISMESSKAIEGYTSGYVADCPGSTKESIITKKTLQELRIVGLGINGSTQRLYNYYQIKNLPYNGQFDFDKRTVMFVSGFLDSTNYPIANIISNAYRRLGYNVLLLDTNYFTTMPYPRASRMTHAVGKHTAAMLARLTQAGLNPKKLELIGLSLGAQTASFIAKNYRLQTGMNLSRLTGLDPAGPCFRNLGPKDRIDKSDADFVDVIGTNIDGFGMAAPVGHVNFYVNGGEYQPGQIVWMYCDVFCSHVRAFLLWLSALDNPDKFIAIECDSVQQARNKDCYDRNPRVKNVLGLNTDRRREGIFFLPTDSRYPFYLGEKGLKKDIWLNSLAAMNSVENLTI